ncbi:MAG: hypothetical protein ABSE46_14005 [Terracidiphilus sp.]
MPEPIDAELAKTPAGQKTARYNVKMAGLFAERDKHAVDSLERQVCAEAILALWVEEG